MKFQPASSLSLLAPLAPGARKRLERCRSVANAAGPVFLAADCSHFNRTACDDLAFATANCKDMSVAKRTKADLLLFEFVRVFCSWRHRVVTGFSMAHATEEHVRPLLPDASDTGVTSDGQLP